MPARLSREEKIAGHASPWPRCPVGAAGPGESPTAAAEGPLRARAGGVDCARSGDRAEGKRDVLEDARTRLPAHGSDGGDRAHRRRVNAGDGGLQAAPGRRHGARAVRPRPAVGVEGEPGAEAACALQVRRVPELPREATMSPVLSPCDLHNVRDYVYYSHVPTVSVGQLPATGHRLRASRQDRPSHCGRPSDRAGVPRRGVVTASRNGGPGAGGLRGNVGGGPIPRAESPNSTADE